MKDVKRCCQCKVVKPLSEFYRKRKGSDDRQSRCRPCDNKVRAYGQRSNAASASGVRDLGRDKAGRPHRHFRMCKTCSSLADRVLPAIEGATCRECGLPYKPREEIHATAGRDASRVVYPESNDLGGPL